MIITNNTKITIKNIRSQQTTTLLDTNSEKKRVTGNVVAGIPFIDTVDNSLDSFVIQIKDIPQRELFKPFDFVVFTINDGFRRETKEYFVLFDSVQTYSQLRKTYLHNLSLIEPTKILEKTKIFNLNLTNKHDTFFEQLTKAISNADIAFYNKISETEFAHLKANRFYITASLEDFCENKSGRDFYFSNTDLRSVLDEMLGAYNARVTVEDVNYDADGNINLISLGYRDMTSITEITPTWTKEEQGEIIFERSENDGQNHAGTIVARGNNSIADEVLVIKDIPRSQEATISDVTAALFLPFPISDKGIKSLRVELPISYKIESTENAEISDELYKTVYVDLTGYFIPQENYNLLSITDSRKKMPYPIGGTTIPLGKAYKNWLGFQSLSLLEVFNEEAKKVVSSVLPNNAIDIGYPNEIKNLVYEIKYYPIYDTVASVSKPNTYDKDDLLMGIMDSQTEKTLDIDRHGKKLAGLIKRTGNAEFYLDVKAKYYSKLLPLMSKIDLPNSNEEEKGYVLYKREYSIYDNHIDCRYYFSKDFNAVQQNAGVNREKHLFDIPLESSETPIIVKNYMVFSKRQGYANGFSSDLAISAVKTLIGENKMFPTGYVGEDDETELWIKGQLKYLFFKSKNNNELFPQNTDISSDDNFPYKQKDNAYFMLPLGAYTLNKTMTFIGKPLDNYSVGYSRTGYIFSLWGDGGWRMSHNRYVSKNIENVGEAESFQLNYIFDYLYSDKIKDIFVIPESSPIIDIDDEYCQAYSAMNNNITVEYYKDRTQTPLFVFALECVPSKADYGGIIIGTEFAKKNNLVRDNGNGLKGLKLYASAKFTFNGDENLLFPAYMEEKEPQDVSAVFSVEEYTYSGGHGAVLKPTIKPSCASWAIADEQGNIYLAVNGELCDIYATVANFPY